MFFGPAWFLFWVSDFGSLLFVSHSLMSDSLRPHGLYNARHPCPSPLIFLKLMPIESMMPSSHLLLCHLLLLLPSIIPASESFPINGLFTTSGQTIGASALALVLLLNIQCWFPLGLTNLISMHSKGLSRIFSWKLYFRLLRPWLDCWLCSVKMLIRTF